MKRESASSRGMRNPIEIKETQKLRGEKTNKQK